MAWKSEGELCDGGSVAGRRKGERKASELRERGGGKGGMRSAAKCF